MSKKEGIYTLIKPFAFEGEQVTEVTLRRPTGKDMIQTEQELKAIRGPEYSAGQVELQLVMLAKIMGRTVEFVEAMSAADIGKLLEDVDNL